ncbi:MAG: DNA polymerase III subunit gamma/tau [Lachnospiraceae bacterium]|nr:DNA polymerase III subunit gamma/tau [Lachnospiraceae bacterium]
MSYMALYRKFRPSGFEDVKGQEHIVTTLKNEIQTGRTSHAYLFCGTRGTGKTTVAKILAKAVNCENPENGSPCNKCSTCQKINRQASMNVIEIDAASNNGVANIREIIEEVQYSPAEGKYKVYIIDEVHMLSTGAFNALLKTLEEPPSYVIFILATTEAHKIPITILSRCQRYDFKRISVDTIAGRLRELMDKEGIEAEEEALRYIAKAAEGSLRDALSLLDQCIAFYPGQKLSYDNTLDVLGAVDMGVYSQMFNYIIKSDVTGCIKLIDDMMAAGRNLSQFVTEFIWYLRNLLITGCPGGGEGIIDVSSEQLLNMQEDAAKTDADVLTRYIYILSELSGQIRYASQKRVLAEICFIKLCKPQMDAAQDLSSVLSRLVVLEKQLSGIMENGIMAAGTQPEGSTQKTSSGISSREQEKYDKEKVLQKAVTEDIKEIIRNWNKILQHCGRVEQDMLFNAKRLVSESGTLVLQFTDPVEEAYFKQDDSRQLEALKTIIANVTGKETTIETRTVTEETDLQFTDLSQIIHFDGIEYK